ncbi:hypothetical protein PACTADRAFT_27974, partial [Pachysolen tannophilus NRRL Y-2460]
RRLTMININEINEVRRNLATDQKTPAEYTLHILFTQFVRHAERKLNLCLNTYSLDTEPPINELLAEGVDPAFDKIIESLGYIARRKPKPVIDSVMFWRKSKSEVAILASSAVEKNIKILKQEQRRLIPSTSRTISNPEPPLKEHKGLHRQASLSFMRSHKKSSSKLGPVTSSSSTSNSPVKDRKSNSISSSDNGTNLSDINNNNLKSLAIKVEESKETAIQAERKSLISIYILCRVLIEVVKQTPNDVLGDDLGDKLEEIIHSQLKTTDPILISKSLIRSSNWNLFAELLGYMSDKRFLSVSDRFIADLEKVPPNISNNSSSSISKNNLRLLIHGMRYLKLRHYPLENFEESSDFLQSVGKFFSKCQNENVLLSYAEVLNQILLPLAGIVTAEVNHPTWSEAIDLISQKALWMLSYKSGQFWASGINLVTTSLSVSNSDLFLDNWLKIIESNVNILKPKVPKASVEDKIIYITCCARLTWTYLFRCTESLNNTVRNLDRIFKLLFFNNSSKKQQWITSDLSLIQASVQLLRSVGYSNLNYTLENVLLPLIKSSYNGSGLEGISQEKLILCLRSYIAILIDVETKKRPPFPTDEVLIDIPQQRNAFEFINIDSRKKNGSVLFSNGGTDIFEKNSSNASTHEELTKIFLKLFQTLDSSIGAPNWQLNSSSSAPDNGSVSNTSSSPGSGMSISSLTSGASTASSTFSAKSPFSSFLHNNDFSSHITKNLNIELFSTLIDTIPYGSSSGLNISYRKLVELLVRNSVHGDVRISSAAINTLKVLLIKKNPKILIITFARYAFQFDEKSYCAFDVNYLTSKEYQSLLKIYVDLLNCWLNSFKEILKNSQPEAVEVSINGMNPNNINNMNINGNINNPVHGVINSGDNLVKVESNKISDELELKNIITIIEEVEGNGLFFLCSQDSRTRHFGLQILKIVSTFDEVIDELTIISSNTENTKEDFVKDQNQHKRTPSKFTAEVGTRLIHILSNTDFFELISPLEKELTLPEKKRLKELNIKKRKNILTSLARSDYGIDSTLWFKIFPKVLTIIFEKCPIPIALCRSIVCVRLVQIHEPIFSFSEESTSRKAMGATNSASKQFSPPELLVEQWRIYLIVACTTLTSTNEQRLHIPSGSISGTSNSSSFTKSHIRKRSQQVLTVQHQKITSAKSIFKMVVPLLKTQQPTVRDAIVAGLSCVNVNIFKSFLESIDPSLNDDHPKHNQRDLSEDRLKIELARILNNITARFLDNRIYADEWILGKLVAIIKSLKMFLSIPSIQTDFVFQRLRRYFSGILENVYLGISQNFDADVWLPFEARASCFSFLEEWCGYGASAAVAQERYNYMIKNISSSKDSISLNASLELERSALEYSSVSCMAALCSSPIMKQIEESGKSVLMSFDIPGLLHWISALFNTKNAKLHSFGRKALFNILSLNTDNKEIYSNIFECCYTYHENPKTAESYFLTFADAVLKLDELPAKSYQIVSLALCAAGSDNFKMRVAAAKLLKHTEKKAYNSNFVDRFTESVCSRTKVIYKRAIFNMSSHFASTQPEESFKIISELTKWFHVVSVEFRRDLLAILLPWFNSVKLQLDDENKEDVNTLMVLNNLFEISIKFSDRMQNEVEALWVALANGNNMNNIKPIMYFINSDCLKRRLSSFVEYSRQVIVYLSLAPAGSSLIDDLISNLEPKAMVPPQPDTSEFQPTSDELPYIADLWKYLSDTGKESVFSLGQISMIFLVDLFIASSEVMRTKLALLLHVSFSLLDHYLFIVQDQACEMLIHLIHGLALDEPKAADTISLLRKRDYSKSLWVYDDLNSDRNGTRTPRNMDVLTRNMLEIFRNSVPNLQEDWSRVSLTWATTCAVRHIACRSFQIFRSLLSFLDQGMLRDMLHRLSNTISDETPDIQGFAMQILMTLNAITAELSSEKLIDFPQLFWSSVSCLSTVHEQEFIEVLSALSKFVSKIDLDSPDTVSCLISTFPPKWEGKFDGLQQIVMIGLRSSNAWEPCLALLDRLNKLHDSDIIGSGDSRLLLATLSNLPRFLHALAINEFPVDIIDAATAICGMVERFNANAIASNHPENDRSDLSRILSSFIKKKFRTKQDFLSQIVNTIKKYFFNNYQAQTVVFLLGILSNKIDWVKIETMELLEKIFPLIDLQKEEFIGVGADLISPLLRLLLTDYAEKALTVLDKTVSISGSQLDKDVLRMSLGNKTIRKGYEKTATLFGIPEESGWAIPMPAVTAATTRNNIHAVFSTCVVASNAETEQQDNQHYHQYQAQAQAQILPEFGDTISVIESHVAENDSSALSNIYAALDNLDSFFTREINDSVASGYGNSSLHQYRRSTDTSYSNSDAIVPFESAPQVYDKKVSAILNRSLARTPSSTSFKTSLADSFGSSPTALSEHYFNRDNNGNTLPQRSSYISFKSNRNSTR